MSIAIDLSAFQQPDVVAQLDEQTILDQLLADFATRMPDIDVQIGDPIYNTLLVMAHREVTLRAELNDASLENMLAFAQGENVDHLGGLLNIEREPDETDDRYRARIQRAADGFSVAGSEGAYIKFAFDADPLVKDVAVTSPAPSEVHITILSSEGDGTPSAELLATVNNHLSDKTVRPLGDRVTVLPAQIITYQIDATLRFDNGPSAEIARQNADQAVTDYVTRNFALNRPITLSGLYSALHQQGISDVVLNQPLASINVNSNQAAFCTSINVELAND